MLTVEDFQKFDIRVGKIIDVEYFPKARKPSYLITVDFGEFGTKKTIAQATNYKIEELIGMQIIAILNLPVKRIAGFPSEILILGVPAEEGGVSLIIPSKKAIIGGKVY